MWCMPPTVPKVRQNNNFKAYSIKQLKKMLYNFAIMYIMDVT